MNSKDFNNLFKDLISHLYDHVALEIHPLAGMITPPADFDGSPGEYLRDLIHEEIERFRPEGRNESMHSIEWRSYNILKSRYIDGVSLRELSQSLSLSQRQIRRDNSRALQALTRQIWEKVSKTLELGSTSNKDEQLIQQSFETVLEKLDIINLLEGVAETLQNRIASEAFQLHWQIPNEAVFVMVDRIVVRQILISLISYFLNFPSEDNKIHLEVKTNHEQAIVQFWSTIAGNWAEEDENNHLELLASAKQWSQQMNVDVEASHPPQGQLGKIEIMLRLPLTARPIILVIDDQKPMHQMFRRFLSKTNYQVVGITDSSEALSMARQLQPRLITLDVMMPKVDGWEVLQAFKTDMTTQNIPVLVCSAWEEPELAESLGAAGFIKKPVRQQDLLAALERMNL